MAEKATRIYLNYPQLFNEHIRQHFSAGNPFDFAGLEIIANSRESKKRDEGEGAQVIIAGSGMMTGGRILGHAAHFLPIPSTRLLLVGFQGEETLGRELQEGHKTVTINGQPVAVNAAVSSIRSMSSHADQGQLLEWLGKIKGVKRVFLTHGENQPRSVLAEKITAQLHLTDITQPDLHEEVNL